MSEEENQRLKEYQKNYCESEKSKCFFHCFFSLHKNEKRIDLQ